MPNITLSLNEDLLKAGRRYAHDHNTSLNALVRDLLGKTVQSGSGKKMEEIFKLMDEAGGNSRGQKWKREDLYDV